MLLGLRQEADEGKARRIHAGRNEAGQTGIGSGKGYDRQIGFQSQADHIAARVTDSRHTGIADQRDHQAVFQFFNELRPFFRLIMFMIAGQWRIDVIRHEQLLRVTRIFCRNEVGLAETADRAVRNVLEIADRRRAKIERPFLKNFWHCFSSKIMNRGFPQAGAPHGRPYSFPYSLFTASL